MSGNGIDALAAEARALQEVRELLTPILKKIERTMPSAEDAAIVVTFRVRGARVPIVIATNRRRIAGDCAAYAKAVEAELPHDRGKDADG